MGLSVAQPPPAQGRDGPRETAEFLRQLWSYANQVGRRSFLLTTQHSGVPTEAIRLAAPTNTAFLIECRACARAQNSPSPASAAYARRAMFYRDSGVVTRSGLLVSLYYEGSAGLDLDIDVAANASTGELTDVTITVTDDAISTWDFYGVAELTPVIQPTSKSG